MFLIKWHVYCSPCDRPRVIESLRGKDIVDIAAGGAHSACVTSAGELYTWGKGRYGRLGHGDSEDQTRPKLVCTLDVLFLGTIWLVRYCHFSWRWRNRQGNDACLNLKSCLFTPGNTGVMYLTPGGDTEVIRLFRMWRHWSDVFIPQRATLMSFVPQVE